MDGIIGITYSDIDQYISSNLPFVSIDRYFTEDVIYVTADNAAGGRLAVDELLKRRCRHLAYIGGYQETPNETKNRRKYFEIECNARQVQYDVLDMLEPLTQVNRHINEFLEAHPGIDGIFTINDDMALTVCDVLQQRGQHVPDDVQVIGFDGQRIKEQDDFLVSTIVQPVALMAQRSVDSLLAVIAGQTVDNRTVLPVAFGASWTTQPIQ